MSIDYERLQSLDEQGSRAEFFIAEVKGYWRRRREWVHLGLIFFFLALPWTRIQGQQTLLFHIQERKFVFFGLTFFAHDAPLIFFILATLTLGLAFITSLWGRVWCGWACPQTVFIDAIYRNIEKWTEGTHLRRRALAKEDFSFKKMKIKFYKWFLFFVVSAAIAHSFLAYFVGARELLAMMGTSPSQNSFYFILVFAMTGLLLFNFGWFREQFCIIMCPYGRFQSVLLDEKSLTIFYDKVRGEPRKGVPLAKDQRTGSCISCNRCVEVCPTRIDIRNGLQMECIACTACIDACDDIMRKTQQPEGLIRYAAQDGTRPSFWKPRTAIYLIMILCFVLALAWNVMVRPEIHYSLLRANDAPYLFTKNQQGENVVLNHFRIHLKNQTAQKISLSVEKQGAKNVLMTMAQDVLSLESYSSGVFHVFFQFPKDQSSMIQKESLQVILVNASSGKKYSIPVPLIGPNDEP